MIPQRQLTPAERARNLRYKRPAMQSIGFHEMIEELYAISDKCSDVHWWMDTDTETLLNALDGDEDDAFEFRFAFSDLEAKCEHLQSAIYNNCIDSDVYDNCTVALIGNRYKMVGFDSFEEDYFSLSSYEARLAEQDCGKRLMRMTKQEMISTIGQCMGIILAFLDLRQQFDYLSATFDILRDQNTSMLDTIKEIEKLYDEADDRWSDRGSKWDKLLNALPDEFWLM